MSDLPLTLVVLAAGLSRRYGRMKQLDPLGSNGEALLDYALHDALLAGFSRVVFIVRESTEAEFREHLAPAIRAGVEISFVHQSGTDLPDGFSRPQERQRPWGTAHAVWCAREQLTGPFAVCNADDFYGRHAYFALAEALRGSDAFCLVGYRLEHTLTSTGGVSRGLVVEDGGGWVTGVTELLGLEAVDGPHLPGAGVAGVNCHGVPVELDAAACVSMNLWGFQASLLPQLGVLFRSFLEEGPGEQQEFFLSQAVGDLLQCEQARCRLVTTEANWLGVTYPEDGERVRAGLAQLVSQGEYPADLSRAWKSLLE